MYFVGGAGRLLPSTFYSGSFTDLTDRDLSRSCSPQPSYDVVCCMILVKTSTVVQFFFPSPQFLTLRAVLQNEKSFTVSTKFTMAAPKMESCESNKLSDVNIDSSYKVMLDFFHTGDNEKKIGAVHCVSTWFYDCMKHELDFTRRFLMFNQIGSMCIYSPTRFANASLKDLMLTNLEIASVHHLLENAKSRQHTVGIESSHTTSEPLQILSELVEEIECSSILESALQCIEREQIEKPHHESGVDDERNLCGSGGAGTGSSALDLKSSSTEPHAHSHNISACGKRKNVSSGDIDLFRLMSLILSDVPQEVLALAQPFLANRMPDFPTLVAAQEVLMREMVKIPVVSQHPPKQQDNSVRSHSTCPAEMHTFDNSASLLSLSSSIALTTTTTFTTATATPTAATTTTTVIDAPAIFIKSSSADNDAEERSSETNNNICNNDSESDDDLGAHKEEEEEAEAAVEVDQAEEEEEEDEAAEEEGDVEAYARFPAIERIVCLMRAQPQLLSRFSQVAQHSQRAADTLASLAAAAQRKRKKRSHQQSVHTVPCST
jgi:hypothetical protein